MGRIRVGKQRRVSYGTLGRPAEGLKKWGGLRCRKV